MFPVAFDEFALGEDLARLGAGGREALGALARDIDRLGGLPRGRLMACQAEGTDGTRLAQWRQDIRPVARRALWRGDGCRQPLRSAHRPPRHRFRSSSSTPDAHALSVYQVAHSRLNG